ncbi:hypothetical protein QMK34_06810 [Amycolatopsis sp. H20-H5]|nr:hypothetical protein [Amycolatopsis sp. H20-H5]
MCAGLVLAVVAASVPAATAQPNSSQGSWSSDFSVLEAGSSHISVASGVATISELTATTASSRSGSSVGIALFAPRRLSAPVTGATAMVDVSAARDSGAAVDVRGRRADGTWGEWIEASGQVPATFTEPTSLVQTRVFLTAERGSPGPAVRNVRVNTSTSGNAAVGQAAPSAVTYRVFATREGLVGGTTANGHVIAPRDHFVALPSRRGLSANGSRTYSVRVCTPGGRCETAPVWDVGPWNTTDDYWNPSVTRQSWKNLPQGQPEAQAAYQNGFNGGRDEFGRTVANPAGIDLADGTFYDGLGLRDNAFVTVTYLWT